MPNLSEQDHQKILAFLQGLYTSTNFETFSNYICQNLPYLVSGEFPVYVTVDFEKRQIIQKSLLPEVPDFDETVKKHFHEHPFSQHYAKTLDFSAIKLSDFMTREQLHRSEPVYQKFMHHIGMEDNITLSLPYAVESTNTTCTTVQFSKLKIDSIGLFREERTFTERDRTILNLLYPHLMQARQTILTISETQQENQILNNYLNAAGSIILSREGRVQWITKKAERLLKQYFHDFSYLGQTLPERLKQWIQYQRSLLSTPDGIFKPRLPLKVEQGNQQLTIRLVTDLAKEHHLLVLSEQKRPTLSSELLETLGLSFREAEVLFWVMDGKTNIEIASILALSISTVRKHLEHIYLKLGAQTRAAAVVAAFKKLGVLNLEWSSSD